MARHRNIRSMNYSDEYDGYDDVYGHSVEEDGCISPSDAAQFLYNRDGKNRSIGSYLQEDTIAEADESKIGDLAADIDKSKLDSCIEKMKNVIGDTIPTKTLIEQAVKNELNPEKTLDAVLSAQVKGIRSEPTIRKVVPQSINVTKGFDVTDKTSYKSSLPSTPRALSPVVIKDNGNEGRVTPEVTVSKKETNKIDPLELYKKERASNKEHLYMVVIGHVDAGKSTLMGHILYSMGQVNQRTMHKYETESKKLGKQSFAYAWVLDETGEERQRGITMDIGRSQFETTSKRINLLDAPGHKDFIPNMISGAAQADVALLVVDATRGEFETGFESGGQTREHALLLRSLGVSQMAVAVNKLDTVNWSKERFDDIVNKLGAFLKQAGYREKDVTYVPCSGLTGENLVSKSTEAKLNEWYDGPTVVDVIDKFVAPERPVSKPFRMSVDDVFKGLGAGFCAVGRVETGIVSVGDRVLVCPSKESATVRNVTMDDVNVTTSFAGDHVCLTLTDIDMENVSTGTIISSISKPIPVATRFEARIVVFNLKVPITRGYPVLLHHQSLVETAIIKKLIAQINKSTGEVIKKKPRCLVNNSSAIVEIMSQKAICIENYKDIKELGRIMLRVGGITIAAGLVTNIIE